MYFLYESKYIRADVLHAVGRKNDLFRGVSTVFGSITVAAANCWQADMSLLSLKEPDKHVEDYSVFNWLCMQVHTVSAGMF